MILIVLVFDILNHEQRIEKKRKMKKKKEIQKKKKLSS